MRRRYGNTYLVPVECRFAIDNVVLKHIPMNKLQDSEIVIYENAFVSAFT